MDLATLGDTLVALTRDASLARSEDPALDPGAKPLGVARTAAPLRAPTDPGSGWLAIEHLDSPGSARRRSALSATATCRAPSTISRWTTNTSG